MYKITAPTLFTGVGYGLRFVEGVAQTDNKSEYDRLKAKLESKGYTFETPSDGGDGELPPGGNPPSEETAELIKKLKKMGRAELDAWGAELGLDVAAAPNADAVRALIEAKLLEDSKPQA